MKVKVNIKNQNLNHWVSKKTRMKVKINIKNLNNWVSGTGIDNSVEGSLPRSSQRLPAHSILRKLNFHFLSNWMGYDRGGSFLFDFEPNGISLVQNLMGKLSPRSYSIEFERK